MKELFIFKVKNENLKYVAFTVTKEKGMLVGWCETGVAKSSFMMDGDILPGTLHLFHSTRKDPIYLAEGQTLKEYAADAARYYGLYWGLEVEDEPLFRPEKEFCL